MSIWDMRRTYLNIRRLRHIIIVLAKHGFSHVIERMRFSDYLPWVGRLLEKGDKARTDKDLPTRLAEAFEEIGPVYVKLGQILASRPDLVPPEFQVAFAKLHDQVPPLPGEEIIPEVEKALGKPLSAVFASFNPDARGGGSIGQVHEAELLDGTPVMVKVKRIGIEKIIEEDLSLLDAMAEMAQRHIPELAVVRPVMLAKELRRAITHELDYVGEAAYAAKFRESMRYNDRVVVPNMYWNYVSRELLVMQRVEGKPISDVAFLPQAERSDLAQVIAECFMHQYFESGLFHADPHQGNILYRDDGTVGLIDFGQMGRLSENLRRALGRMLMALKEGDYDLLADIYAEVGEFSPDANLQGFRADLVGLVDRNYGMPADRIDFTVLAQESMEVARQNGLYLPRDFVLLVKSLMLVAGVVRDLDPGFRIDKTVTPYVRGLWLNSFSPDRLVKNGWAMGTRLAGVFRRLPDDFRDLMEKARAGRLTIVFHHENLENVTERAGRALDRLSLGIISAAIIIGSAIVLVAGKQAAAE
ncbi:MAG: hypothetical protein LIP23_08395 [Planctomycetes bacterium]|nr:hypothetical protein [Planctomycetota bacterium]